jgi:hypothetical protein
MTHEPGAVRAAATSGALLVPIWGYRFVSQFLEFGLPTLLASGNLPAIARDLPFRVVALSSEGDEPLIRSHPAWRRLERICPAEVQLIDDLITDANHTATITLAFERAMRNYGESITDTCFILWMSDYLVGNGSLAAVVRRLQDGASGVVAGNFQVVAEDAIPSLRRIVDPGNASIDIPNRQLIAWSLAYLHPATAANIVNFGLVHNAHTNRLFWRVNEETLIGRFYLIHPIGVRPETADFEISSSFDYSFMPEMCPSGRVQTITSSDDYCVVEMQRREHETNTILPGPVDNLVLAADLSQWTTAQHRESAVHTVVFQAGDTPENLPEIVAEADRFISGVGELLVGPPQPHRNHPFWVGSIAISRARTGRPLTQENWRFLHQDFLPRNALAKFLLRVRAKIFGPVPNVTRLHPRWPDYKLLHDRLAAALAGGSRVLLAVDTPTRFAHWLSRSTGDITTLDLDGFLSSTPQLYEKLYEPLTGKYDSCFVMLPEAFFARADEVIERLGPLLTRDGQMSVFIMNDRPVAVCMHFSEVFARDAARLLSPSSWIAETSYVQAGRFRWRIYRASQWFADGAVRAAAQRQTFRLICHALGGLLIAPFAYLGNIGVTTSALPPVGIWSSIFLQLRRSDRKTRTQSRFANWWAGGDTSSDAASAAAGGFSAACRSAEVTAKYDFVIGLIAHRQDVAEYGCLDENGSQRVLQNVTRLAVYDCDLQRLGEVSRKLRKPWRIDTEVHDLLLSPLPRIHDAIYNLDILEYVSPSDEDIYLHNLAHSLSRPQDILIISHPLYKMLDGGDTPPPAWPAASLANSLPLSAVRPHANEQSAGPRHGAKRYPRTGDGLRALLERHFGTVMVFSMAAGVVYPGTRESADCVLAVCSAPKRS